MRFLLCLLLIAMPAAARHKEAPIVEVFIPSVHDAQLNLALYRAQGVASDIYSEVGVTLKWRLPNPKITGCSKNPPLLRTIVVALSWNTPDNSYPAALAFSNPYSAEGACVTIFVDRLKPMVALQPLTTSVLLGHVLAHEMGHVLQGIARHSETGVLKQRWSPLEIDAMWNKPLRFTDHDATLILEGIRGLRRVASEGE